MFTSSAVVSVWMVLQIFHVIHAGHFTILPVKKNPIAVTGEDVTIPCQLMSVNIPNNTAIEVHWIFSNSSKPIDVIYYHRKNKEEKELKNYGDRAELFYNELNRGNMSLKLRNISLSDQGKYTCVVTTETGFDEIVTELKVTANGDKPTITLVDYKGEGIGLTCSSEGWYPRPQALWLDSKGRNRMEKSAIVNTEVTTGNFHVFSSITLEPGMNSEVSCKIINNLIKTESESRILISDAFYPTSSPWITAFITILVLSSCLTVFVTYKWRQSFKEVLQSQKETNEMKRERDHEKNAIGKAGMLSFLLLPLHMWIRLLSAVGRL
ncbi:putative selection and upkeep of intraepithelial T-cells protein 1 homolog isoform 2-T3 [Liasis olivaceus]